MKLLDKNQSWTPPEGYTVSAVVAVGSYLRVEFRKPLHRAGYRDARREVNVFLNDQGREVARTEENYGIKVPKLPNVPVVVVGSRWPRFCTGWYLILSGLEEIIRCLKR